MKRIIVIVLILILVAGGGAGALIMLGIVPNPFATPQKEMSASEKAAAAADKKKFQPPLSAYKFVKPDDLIIPVIINGQVKKRVYVTVRLMAASPSFEAAIKAKVGSFQNEVIGDLVPFFQVYFLDHETIDLTLLKERLMSHAKHVFGGNVQDVLLGNVFEQAGGR
jgi:flagellar basal body-associated protein FliL